MKRSNNPDDFALPSLEAYGQGLERCPAWKSLPIKVVGVFVSLWLLNLYGLPKSPYQIGRCISELMGGLGDENKNKAGLPGKTLRRLSSTTEND